MTTSSPNQVQRQDAIVDLVMTAGTLRIDELCEMFDVSTMTIHRDLDVLDSRGILRKSRGLVTAVASNLFEANPEYRKRQMIPQKIEIAHAAFQLVEPGQAVMLDDSTTGVHLAGLLLQKPPLTVITNFQPAIDVLIKQPGISVVSLGGLYFQWSNSYMGAMTISALESLRANIFFMSTPSVIDGTCFHQHEDANLFKSAMFQAAEKRYLLLDHGKFLQRALHRGIPLKDFDAVIVDSETSEENLNQITEVGGTAIVAGRL